MRHSDSPSSGRPAFHYMKPDVDDPFNGPAFDSAQQGLRGSPAYGGPVDPHRRQWGERVCRKVEVGETDDGQIPRHGQTARLRLDQHSVGKSGATAENLPRV